MRRSPWSSFPLAVVAGLALVVVVNAGMVYAALDTFPGQAGDEDFQLSNHYDMVLEREQREASLGWTVAVQTDATRTPEITLAGRDASPLIGASITATAERPLGSADRRALIFHETAAGRYVADAPLPRPGQWDLTLSASFAGHGFAVTRRVIVR